MKEPPKLRTSLSRSSKAFDDRYDATFWTDICALAHRTVNGICCHCMARASQEVHHVRYSDEHGAIAGREIPGEDIFPLCQQCHGLHHTKRYWIKSKVNPALNNRATDDAIELLKNNYEVLANGVEHGNLSNHRRLRQPESWGRTRR